MKENLTEKEKEFLTKKAIEISETDEIEIKKNAVTEIDKLKKLASASKKSEKFHELIRNAQLFSNMLNEKEFFLPLKSRKWIAFGLDYLISPFDLIPDAIPGIGYSDDALVLSWIKYLIIKDVERYLAFVNAIELQKRGGCLMNLKQGKNNHIVMVISGILAKANDPQYTAIWLKQLDLAFPDSSMAIYDWNKISTIEMEEDIRNLDHSLSLRVSYDTDDFQLDWKDAKTHADIFAKTFLKDLDIIVKTKKYEKITLICHSLGCRLFANCMDELKKELIDEVFFLAGAVTNRQIILNNCHKVNKVHNLYFENDYVLKFLFENFENGNMPIGIKPLTYDQNNNIIDVDCAKIISKHSDYKEKLADLI